MLEKPVPSAVRSAAPGLLAAALLAGPAAAQPAEGAPPSPWRVTTQLGAVHQFDADLDEGGSIGVTRSFGQVSVGYGFDRRTSVGLALGLGYDDYEFSDGATLGGGAPWDDVVDYRLSLPVRFGIGESVDAIVIPSVRWRAETDASLDDGRTEGVLAGASWRVSPGLSVGPGVGVFSEIDGGTNVFPILLLDWDVTDRLNIGTGGGFGATQGPGLEATWRVTDATSLALGARYENLEFALDGDGPAPDGIGEETAVPVYLVASWAPTPLISVSAIAGVELAGEVTLRDGDGREIDSDDYDPAPFLGLTGAIRF
jgi:hypothetical protein